MSEPDIPGLACPDRKYQPGNEVQVVRPNWAIEVWSAQASRLPGLNGRCSRKAFLRNRVWVGVPQVVPTVRAVSENRAESAQRMFAGRASRDELGSMSETHRGMVVLPRSPNVGFLRETYRTDLVNVQREAAPRQFEVCLTPERPTCRGQLLRATIPEGAGRQVS